MSSHFHCVEYTKVFLICHHRQMSAQSCNEHLLIQMSAAPRMCNSIKIRMNVLSICARCKAENPSFDDFYPISPIMRSESTESLESTISSIELEPSTMQDAFHDTETNSKVGRRQIGLLELQTLGIQIQRELLENPVSETSQTTKQANSRPAIFRQNAVRRQSGRTAQVSPLVHAKPRVVELRRRQENDLQIRPSPPRDMALVVPPRIYQPYRSLVHANPEAVELHHRQQSDSQIRPSVPRDMALVTPPRVYQPYRRPSSILLLDSPSLGVPAVVLHAAKDSFQGDSSSRLPSSVVWKSPRFRSFSM